MSDKLKIPEITSEKEIQLRDSFIEKMLELGAVNDQACSKAEHAVILKEAQDVYTEHLKNLRQLLG